MQQGLLNSHFKVQKRKSEDPNSELKKNSLNINGVKPDNKVLIPQSGVKGNRMKRAARGDDDSFEIPEVSQNRKRVKLESKPKKKETNNSNVEMNESTEKPKKVEKVEKDENIANLKKPKISSKEEIEKPKSKTKAKTEKPKKTISKTSKASNSTVDSSQSPAGNSELSSRTKSILDKILKKPSDNINNNLSNINPATKQEYNYLNFKEAFQTPEKFESRLNARFSIDEVKKPYNNEDSQNQTEMKEPVLSSKTLKILNELKTERKNRFNRESTKERVRSESSFSIKFKYEDLLKEERELILPPHYKALLNSFTYLDHTLNFFKLGSKKQKIPTFEEVKKSIESIYKR